MSTQAQAWTEDSVEVAGGKVQLLKGGTGDPLYVLHHDIGNPGWTDLYETLSRSFTVYVPSHPGYDQSDRPEWMRNVRDLAAVHQALLKKLKLDNVTLLGLGFGGWVAAEMVTLAPRQFRRLVLVDAMGILPENGEILDQALVSYIDYVDRGFQNKDRYRAVYGEEPSLEQLEQWDVNREMTFRIAWKPYMYNRALNHLLPEVDVPALVIWGRDDKVVPLECGEKYAQLIPNARLEVIDNCGHFADLERPDEVAKLVSGFSGL